MKRWLLFPGVFLLAVCGMTAEAHGRLRTPIIWGYGEKVTELGDLPPEVSRHAVEKLGTQVTVAFLYERSHLFYLDLWTWNGRYVVHSGDKYWGPDSADWKEMLGEEPSAKYGKPILYRIPLLPTLLIVVVVGFVAKALYASTR